MPFSLSLISVVEPDPISGLFSALSVTKRYRWQQLWGRKQPGIQAMMAMLGFQEPNSAPSVESNCILRQQQILKASVEGAVLGAVGQFDREVRAKSTEKKLTSHGSRHGIG